jgi:hypothetical protein
VYYLQLTNGDNYAASHYFNISAAKTTSSVTTSASATSPAPPPATQTDTHDGGGGLSTGAVAGIAVGATAGIFILVGGLWWSWRVNREKKKKALSAVAAVAAGTQQSLAQGPDKAYYHEASENQIYEAPSNAGPRYYYEAEGVEIER